MIDQFAKSVPNGLIWLPGEDPELPLGRLYKIKVWQPRNINHHRLTWVLFSVLHTYWQENRENVDIDVFRKWLTVKAGFFDLMPDGTKIPKSISFSSMDQEEFSRLYSAVIDFAMSDFIPTFVSRDELDAHIEQLMRGFA